LIQRLSVSLKGMRFSALIGVLPHELSSAQPVEVDISVEIDPEVPIQPAALGSGVAVDYRDLYAIADDCVMGRHNRWLEDVARDISSRVLALTAVTSCVVTVRKTRVTLPGPLDCSEVRVESRNDA
jgi:dihydroneopterin aldolase